MLRGGAAERAGLSAGDELLAVDGWRLRRLDDALRLLKPGSAGRAAAVARPAHADADARRCRQEDAAPGTVALAAEAKPPRAALALRKAWLAG